MHEGVLLLPNPPFGLAQLYYCLCSVVFLSCNWWHQQQYSNYS